MSQQESPAPRQVHGPNWYLAVYKATREIRSNSHRTVVVYSVDELQVPLSAENPRMCVVHLVRELKKARMGQIRRLRQQMEKLKGSCVFHYSTLGVAPDDSDEVRLLKRHIETMTVGAWDDDDVVAG